MSLDFKLDLISGYETLCWIPEGDKFRLSPATDALIWYTMFIDLHLDSSYQTGVFKDSEKLVTEFIRRVRLFESKGWGITEEPLDEGVIRAHLGLRTNVVCLSRAKFAAKVKSREAREKKEGERGKGAPLRKAG